MQTPEVIGRCALLAPPSLGLLRDGAMLHLLAAVNHEC